MAREGRNIAWIVLHIGSGSSGEVERVGAWRNDEATMGRAHERWGGGGATPMTSIDDGSSTSDLPTGLMWSAMHEECPQAECNGIALKFGTVPTTEVMNALSADHWLHLHPEAQLVLQRSIRQTMRDAFYVDTDA